jgi:hypothetical protein
MNSVFMYLHKRKSTNNKIAKSCEFTRKVSFFPSSYSYREIAKGVQFNVLYQNITLLFFSSKIMNISSISNESSIFWYPQCKDDTWFKINMFFDTAALYYKMCMCETVLTQILGMPCYFFSEV